MFKGRLYYSDLNHTWGILDGQGGSVDLGARTDLSPVVDNNRQVWFDGENILTPINGGQPRRVENTTKLHILEHGIPLCKFSKGVPGSWPEGNHWIARPYLCAPCAQRALTEKPSSIRAELTSKKYLLDETVRTFFILEINNGTSIWRENFITIEQLNNFQRGVNAALALCGLPDMEVHNPDGLSHMGLLR